MMSILGFARRDLRGGWKRLSLICFSMVTGIAVVVAVGSFAADIDRAIDAHIQEIVGGELVVSGPAPLDEATRAELRAAGRKFTREVSFSTVARVEGSDKSRLAQVSAVSVSYPLYGTVDTVPADAMSRFKREGGVIADEGLLHQLGIDIESLGRTSTPPQLLLGGTSLPVRGAMVRAPGDFGVRDLVAPRVLVPEAFAEESGLIRKGSRARERFMYRFGNSDALQSFVDRSRADLERRGLTVETLADRRKGFGRVMRDAERYLVLIGLLAMVIGSVGVGGGVSQFLREKLTDIAVLRCIGATPARTVLYYGGELALVGLVAALIAAALGVGLQHLFPLLVGRLVPIPVTTELAFDKVAIGVAAGLGMVLLSALVPLLSVRTVSPQLVLREGGEAVSRRDPLAWLVQLAIVLLFTLWARTLLRSFRSALFFGAGIVGFVVALMVLTGAVAWCVRRIPRRLLSYEMWLGIQQVGRPGNRTGTLLTATAATTFLVVLVLNARGLVLGAVDQGSVSSGPNMIVFDIQEDQREPIKQVLAEEGLAFLEESPVVTMRIRSVKGRTAAELLDDEGTKIPAWTLKREFRSTFRDHLSSSERLLEGSIGSAAAAGTDFEPRRDPASGAAPASVSLESGLAEKLGLVLGDEISFDVQGVPVEAQVGSIREVNWQKVQPNFFIVFPGGVIDEAPKFYMGAVRVRDAAHSAALQQRIVEKVPTVSIIDVRALVTIIEDVLGAISGVVQLLAICLVAAAMTVFAVSLSGTLTSRSFEASLLKTLGAGGSQVLGIASIELAVIAIIGAFSGGGAAVGAAYGIRRYFSSGEVIFSFREPILGVYAVVAVALLIGWMVVRSAYRANAAELLRRGG